jgi:putative transposase
MEKREYSGSGMLCGSHSYASGNPAEDECIGVYGYLKGKSSLMLYEQFGDLKFKYRNREFWCRGYYVDTVGKNTARIQEYIKHQLEEDKMGEQLSIPYPGSPFTGRK